MVRKYSKNKWTHRDLKFDQASPQRGEDVKALQRAINERAKARNLSISLKVDGIAGRATIAKGRKIARSLGIGLRRPGLTMYVQHLIRHPELRLPQQRRRGKHWVETHRVPPGPKVSGNTVTGGVPRDRLVAGAEKAAELSASGARHSFYSQAGSWTVDYAITGEPSGYRSDCSQWVTSTYHSAGCPDPNGTSYTGGYTGTLGAHGRRISRSELKPGDLVLYGSGNFHHVELYVGDGVRSYAELDRASSYVRDRTIGHGSPPVDEGDIDMIAEPNFFTYDLGK